jgi:hypothetical protein
MIGFATFALRIILVLAIGGGLFLIARLLWLSYKERATLAAQGYGAGIRPPQPERREKRPDPIENRPPVLRPVAAIGPYGRGRRREPERRAGGMV